MRETVTRLLDRRKLLQILNRGLGEQLCRDEGEPRSERYSRRSTNQLGKREVVCHGCAALIRQTKAVYEGLLEDLEQLVNEDLVPNMYKLMAPNPRYLDANWNKVKAVMVEPGELDRLTKEIIAVAVSATNSCEY